MTVIHARPSAQSRLFPAFSLTHLLKTVFHPKAGEKLCILIDLDDLSLIENFAFLENSKLDVQKTAYEVFYQGLRKGDMQKLQLKACDFFAYQTTKGSNLELPETVTTPNGAVLSFVKDIYPNYDLILCISTYSATAPLTAAAKQYGFRGATLHGVNDIILSSGLAVDYEEVSRETEKLRLGMTHADNVDIDFEIGHHPYHLHISLGKQEAQKSHGLCRTAPDIVNLPAGEVYFVPKDARGEFPVKFDDGTLTLMHVQHGRIEAIDLLKGDQAVVDEFSQKLKSDPAAGILGELGFGTQVLPYSGRDIQDEKIFGTFHLATGRNDHLTGSVTLDRFKNKHNATHEDILFSSTKTPEIRVRQVRMQRHGKSEVLIQDYEPAEYLLELLKDKKLH